MVWNNIIYKFDFYKILARLFCRGMGSILGSNSKVIQTPFLTGKLTQMFFKIGYQKPK